MKPEEIAQKQLDYYNDKNLEAFCSMYSKNVVVKDLVNDKIILNGMEEFRERYKERFSNELLFAELTNRMVIGNKVIDYENVTGLDPDKIKKAIAIYEIEKDLIQKVWFLWE